MNELPSVLSFAILATLAVAVGILMNNIKPFLELIPGVGPNARNHDATIRLVTLLLTIGSALGYAAATGVLNGNNIVFLVLQVVLQYGTSLGVYHSYNPSQASGTGSATSSTPSPTPTPIPVTLPVAQPAIQTAPIATIDQARLAQVLAEAEAAAEVALQAARSAKAA